MLRFQSEIEKTLWTTALLNAIQAGETLVPEMVADSAVLAFRERTGTFIYKNTPTSLQSVVNTIVNLKHDGKPWKIPAIKELRNIIPELGLVESKKAVEYYENYGKWSDDILDLLVIKQGRTSPRAG